jgi:hypothetical protein
MRIRAAPVRRGAKAESSESHFAAPVRGPRADRHAPARKTLPVATPADRSEREAERGADEVLHMPDPAGRVAGGATTPPPTAPGAPPSPPGAGADGAAAEKVQQALASRGEALDGASRSFFTPRLGRDLSSIRIHADAPAATSARALGALAYTVGRDIVFAAGRHAPLNDPGRRLLAHELVHALDHNDGQLRRQPDKPPPAAKKEPAAKDEPAPSYELASFADDPDQIFAAIKKFFPVPAPQGDVCFGIYGLWKPTGEPRLFYVASVPPTGKPVIRWLPYVGGKVAGGKFIASGKQPSLAAGGTYRLIPLPDTRYDRGAAYQAVLEPIYPKGPQRPAFMPSAALGGRTIHFRVSYQQRKEAAAPSTPVRGDLTALAGNPALAEMYLVFLERFAKLKTDRALAKSGLAEQQVKDIVGSNTKAATVTSYFTQGWTEYKRSGNEVVRFARLEETILTQWTYGNHMVLRNQLEIKSTTGEGLGIYNRSTGRKLYDDHGQPLLGAAGNYRDPGFLTFERPKSRGGPAIKDPALELMAQTLRNIAVDDQVLIYRAAKGYVDNRDLLWPEVAKDWDRWAALEAELREQMKMLIAFLAAELVAQLLLKFGDATQKAVGAVMKILLKGAGYLFNIKFAADVLDMAYECGRELSLVHRNEKDPLDALSQQHLAAAAVTMRQLLVLVLATGITVATMKVAAAGAASIEIGGPGGGGLQPAPAVVGGGRGPRVTAGVAGGPQPGKLTTPLFTPPLQMAKAGEGDGGKAGEGKAGKPAKATPPPSAEQKALETRVKKTRGGISQALEQIKEINAEIEEVRKGSSPDKAREIAELVAERKKLTANRESDLVTLEALEADLAYAKKPFYVKVRDRTTGQDRAAASDALKRAVPDAGDFKGTVVDQASKHPPKTGKIQVDHIVSVFTCLIEILLPMEGSGRVTVEEAVKIIDQPANLMALDGAANNSKLARSWAEWPQWANYYGENPSILSRMKVEEARVRAIIEAQFRKAISDKTTAAQP